MNLKKIIAPLIPFSILSSGYAFAISNDSNKQNKYECNIDFDSGKSSINQPKIDQCLEQIPKNEKITFLQIISSADHKGSYAFNKKLTEERLNKIYSYVSQKIKAQDLKLLSVGKNEKLGKRANILIITEKEEKNIPVITDQSSFKSNNLNNLNNNYSKPIDRKITENYSET
ncbi:MAG: hypothetical protein K2X69_12335, partial [Silvanigrellaceae bacterium]|nr:hypothetical protein [Silvanigrellaceae bacterium]